MRSILRVAVLGALTSLVAGCPSTAGGNDGGNDGGSGGGNPAYDGGNPMPIQACSGGCAANQVCDTAKRVCVDPCGCDAGLCTKLPSGEFKCVMKELACGGATCDPGQVACRDGQCTCLGTSPAAQDTCSDQGQWCRGQNCVGPRRYQECKQDIGGCPAEHTCNQVFSDVSICVKQCTSNANCDRGELCNGGICLPFSLFNGGKCTQFDIGADGGKAQVQVARGNLCLLKDQGGNPTEATPSGNCQYEFFEFYSQGVYPFDVCRPPGAAQYGDRCKHDFAQTAQATQCGTGLECALTRQIDEGVCLKTCNAVEPRNGLTPQPACLSSESCVNLYRQFDSRFNSVLGTCMKKCNVLDKLNNTCPNVGTTPASCVPTDPTGTYSVSADGTGICVPQQGTIAQVGQPCATSDAFKGASCASGQVCTTFVATEAATCFAVCDLECSSASPPARCSSESNATCPGGKTCTRINSQSSAILGVCK